MRKISNRAHLIVQLLLAFCLIGTLSAQTIGYWKFDEKLPGNSADLTPDAILDFSGNSRHGTAAAAMAYIAGSTNHGAGSGLQFTLTADRITVPDSTGVFNFTPQQSFTLEAMIRTLNIGQDGVGSLMCKQSVVPPEWYWRINATGLQQLNINDGTLSRSVHGTRRLNDGQWHHVAVVFDAENQQLRSYVDYQLDGSTAANYSSSGTIGTPDDLWIGAFQRGDRQFDGDMDFARITLGVLHPADFIQTLTYLTDVVPTNNASFLSAGTVAGFNVKSPTVGVAQTNISVILNGTNISNQLSISGNSNDWAVTLPALLPNRLYRMEITVVDLQGHRAGQTNVFDTFDQNNFTIEAEDYNFGGGQFIDNPRLSSSPAEDNYLDRFGTEGIDFAKTNPPATTTYRIGDAIGTIVSVDVLRQKFIEAQASDPGVVDYVVKDFVNGEWANYTRTFPSGTYRIYARMAKGGAVPMVVHLDEVTGGSTTTVQSLSRIGTFRSQPTLNASSFVFVPLTDALGRELAIPLGGVVTLRTTMASGTTGLNENYFIFVPEAAPRVPFISALSPAAGASSDTSGVALQITVRNADTQINSGTAVLKLDGATVTPSVTITAQGAQFDYSAASLSIGLHTVLLTFNDNNGNSVTNSWQFRVANQSVRGYWKFNEKTAGSTVSTAPGAILDVSGNERHGTATDAAMPYVTGSFNYGNTPALRFNSTPDRVVVPDSAGDFNFKNTSFTWEAILRTSTAGNNRAILAKNGTGDGEGEYWWRVPASSGGVQRIGMDSRDGAKGLAGTTVLTDGIWHHVAVVYDTNVAEIRLYADYKLEATLTNVVFTNTLGRPVDLHIGSFVNGGSEFDGDLDSIRISNGALTTNQFLQPTVAFAPLIKSVRPGTNANHVFPKPLISQEVQNRDTQADLGSYRIYVDGADVTTAATILTNATGSTISFTPTSSLADGQHTVLVTFNDTGSPVNYVTNQWNFTVVNNEPIVAFYQFNEKAPGNDVDATPEAVRDSSGNARHGTVSFTNAPGLTYVEGSTNYGNSSALDFILAQGAHIQVPDPTGAFNFTPAQSITFEAIIKTTTIGQSSVGSILAKQGTTAANPGEWYWRIESTGRQRFTIVANGVGRTANGLKALNDNQWHHIAAVYDATAKQMRTYVDYVQDGNPVATTYTSTTDIIGNPKDLWIGAHQARTRYFDGEIDVTRITGAPLDVSWFIPLGGIPDLGNGIQIINPALAGGMFSFGFATQNGVSYKVESVETLGGLWDEVETVSGDRSIRTVAYTVGAQPKFFRISKQ